MTTLVGTTSTHDNALREVERDYRREGYDVVVTPRGDQLPPFLARFEPDLIATKGHESVVVAVKTRADLRSSADLIALAGAVEAQPGWRLDLSVTPPEHVSVVDEDVESLDHDETLARATAALTLSQGQQGEASLLLAWLAAEAALRVYAAREQSLYRATRPLTSWQPCTRWASSTGTTTMCCGEDCAPPRSSRMAFAYPNRSSALPPIWCAR